MVRSTALILEPTPKDERVSVGRRGARADFQKEHDREVEARLYISGLSLKAIAERMAISYETVKDDIAAIRREWREHRIADMDEHVNIELAKLDALEQTYWEAWRDSAKKVVRRHKETYYGTKERMNGMLGSVREPTRSGLRRVQIETPNTGNPAFLAGVERCIDRRIKLLGLDAPARMSASFSNPDGSRPNEPVTDETRVAIILAEWKRTRSVGGGTDAERTGVIDGVATERSESGL